MAHPRVKTHTLRDINFKILIESFLVYIIMKPVFLTGVCDYGRFFFKLNALTLKGNIAPPPSIAHASASTTQTPQISNFQQSFKDHAFIFFFSLKCLGVVSVDSLFFLYLYYFQHLNDRILNYSGLCFINRETVYKNV